MDEVFVFDLKIGRNPLKIEFDFHDDYLGVYDLLPNDLSAELEEFDLQLFEAYQKKHGSASTIERDDDFIIASKDSLHRGLHHFEEKWLKYHKEVFLVIDEAHRATAKTYRKIMECIDKHAEKFQTIGLTATPFRTAHYGVRAGGPTSNEIESTKCSLCRGGFTQALERKG